MNSDNLRSALERTPQCPDIDQLEHADRADIKRHLDECSHCQSELAMLREFQSADVRSDERSSVEWIAGRIKSPFAEASPQAMPWWKQIFATPMAARIAVAMGCVLMVVSGALYLRQSSAPAIDTGADLSQVSRSHDVDVVAPRGDLTTTPAFFEWLPVAGAARYEVVLQEVDRSEVWRGETRETRIAVPDGVRVKIAPSKTLLWQVTALDADGKKIGASNAEKFRLSP